MYLLKKCECKFEKSYFWKKETNELNKKLVVIISADRAEHIAMQEGGSNVIYFNIIIINKKLQEVEYTSTQSLNILTFLQVCGDKKQDLCCTVFKEVFKSIKKFKTTDLPEIY